MKFQKASTGSMMRLFYKGKAIAYYPTSSLDSLSVLLDSLSIYPTGIKFSYYLNDLDSISLLLIDDFNEIQIGNQIWTTRNLNVSHYNNGDSIQEVRDKAIWDTITTGAWCYPENRVSEGDVYGKLYNWFAIEDPRGLVPTGWKVPSTDDVDSLFQLLYAPGVGVDIGTKLKEAGYAHWVKYIEPKWGILIYGTNETGFTALPAGFRDSHGGFFGLNQYCGWWTSTICEDESYKGNPYGYGLGFDYSSMQRSAAWDKNAGFSIRCIKEK